MQDEGNHKQRKHDKPEKQLHVFACQNCIWCPQTLSILTDTDNKPDPAIQIRLSEL